MRHPGLLGAWDVRRFGSIAHGRAASQCIPPRPRRVVVSCRMQLRKLARAVLRILVGGGRGFAAISWMQVHCRGIAGRLRPHETLVVAIGYR